MENSNFSTWITSLYVSQPSSVVFACKTAHFGPEFQVTMGPSPHLRILHTKQRVLAQNYKSLWVPDLTCPFVQSKRPDLHQNIKSILVPALICGFCMQNSDFWTRITNLYGSQTSPVVLCMQYSVISTRITCLWVPTLICGVCIQNSDFWTRITNL